MSELLGAKHLCTTAYHPIVNGLVECFHWQLKASLKASPQPDRWADMLYPALLGIRTAYKDKLHCTAAELVYSTTPGVFFTPQYDHGSDPTGYVAQLRQSMHALPCILPRQPSQIQIHVDSSLSMTSHVFVHCDTVRKPLQQPYDQF